VASGLELRLPLARSPRSLAQPTAGPQLLPRLLAVYANPTEVAALAEVSLGQLK
jgi:hypothetical protein